MVDAGWELPEGWVQGEVSGKVEWTADLFTLAVTAPVRPFLPGQFLRLGLPVHDQWVSRAYSVASAPGTPLEFYVVRVAEGALTPSLHDLRPGDPVGVTVEAAGHFTLDRVPDAEDLWLISTGTGLAPYISMLRTDDPWRRFRRIAVVHGVRHAPDLSYQPELAALSAAHDGRLTYVPVVSREAAPGAVQGRIPQQLAAIEAAAGFALSAASSQVLLCGNPDMLSEMEALLEEKGMHRHRRERPGNVLLERYW